jgi:RNA polymerase sigma-70 factor, ECF subfamily
MMLAASRALAAAGRSPSSITPPRAPRTLRALPHKPEQVDDPPTLAGIYREHARQVARWAARLGGPNVEVEDILQEVFIIAHRQLAGFRGDSRISTWLFAITRNVVRQKLQRERVRRFFLSAASREDQVTLRPSTPIEDIERRESMEMVYRALSGMPEKYRTAFVLFEIEGLSGQEAADLTGVKISTLRVWLLRARAHFMKRMERVERALARERGEGHG